MYPLHIPLELWIFYLITFFPLFNFLLQVNVLRLNTGLVLFRAILVETMLKLVT